MAAEKLLATIRNEQKMPPMTGGIAGQTVNLPDGSNYTMQSAREGVQVQPIPDKMVNRLPPQRATAENPIMTKGKPLTPPTQTDDRTKQIDIAVKQAKGEQLADEDLRFLAEKALIARDTKLNGDGQTFDTYDQMMNNNGQPTAQDIASMTPDQRMAYETNAYDQNIKDQMGMFDQFGQQQNQMFDQRIQNTQAQMEQKRMEGEAQNQQLVDSYTKDQQAMAQDQIGQVKEVAAENEDQLKRNLARRGMSRSSYADSALTKASTGTQRLVAAIERETGSAIRDYQAKLMTDLDNKMMKLEDRIVNLGDQQAQADLGLLKERQKTYADLFSQSPRNPTKMIELADKLKSQQLAELKENNEAAKELRKEAQQNFQFMISNFGSGFVNGLDEQSALNLSANLGMPVGALVNMGKTLKEQENEWEKAKYVNDRSWEQSKFQIEQDNKFALENLRDGNEWQRELWKATREDSKADKELTSILESVGIDYASKANGVSPSALSYETPVPHPVGGRDVVEVNPSIALAKPEGFKYSAADGAGGLGGQCLWYAQQLTNLNGKNWSIGNTIGEKKANLEKYVKQGNAFYPGDEEIQVGQTILTTDSAKWGHGAVVNGKTPDGKLILSESNYVGPLKVSNTRVVDPNDPKIFGVVKTTPKPQYQISKQAVNAVGNVLDQFGPLGKMAGALGKSNPNLGDSIGQTLAGLWGGKGESTQQAPAQKPAQLEQWQIEAFKDMSDTQKQKIMQSAPEVYAQFMQAGAGKKTSDAARLPADKVVLLEDAKFLPGVLDNLETTIKSGKATFDPFWGNVNAINPLNAYDQDQQTTNAELSRAAQLIGKYMEGGVLRAEDEGKYKRMLPNATDTREVALKKLKDVRAMLQSKTQGYLSGFDSAGYDVSGFNQNYQQPQFNQSSANDQSLYNSGNSDMDLWNNL